LRNVNKSLTTKIAQVLAQYSARLESGIYVHLHFSVWLKATQWSHQARQEAEAAGEVKGGSRKILDIVHKTFYTVGLTSQITCAVANWP
jgi:hypothetical protein